MLIYYNNTINNNNSKNDTPNCIFSCFHPRSLSRRTLSLEQQGPSRCQASGRRPVLKDIYIYMYTFILNN